MSDANRLRFVDTNVLIYAHDESAGDKHTRAKALLQELWEDRTGCVSIQVLQEFYVNVTQKVAIPLTAEVAAQIIADLSVWQAHQPKRGRCARCNSSASPSSPFLLGRHDRHQCGGGWVPDRLV